MVQLKLLLKVAIAILLGALIGLDREAARKPAGLRTHMLVAGVAALLIAIGQITVEKHLAKLGNLVVRTDPIRIIAAIITGISFLGAGTILRDDSGANVKGLTTAASLLFAAVVGMSAALSQWIIAFGSTVFALLTLRLMPWVERKIIR